MKRSHLVKIAMIALLSLTSIGIIGGSFFLRKAFSTSDEIKVITDTSRYKEIRQQWSNSDHIQHFPDHLPSGTKNVRIAYYSGLPPEGSFFQIRLKQSPEKIQTLLSQYQNMAKHQYKGGSTNDHVNLENGVPTTFFYTSDASIESFPPTYTILVLDAKDRGTPGFKWNHGHSYGVAIDSSASEIVYWAEKW
ncbi:hypothetical protein [Nodularia sphaerocarpa]|uniref:hypothetical protein n=1 Tax=Nodularia sphaerocarpa TaxID=137816 RepID=UPI001EFA2B75|nr:hypothetical protein [Nodularia sphaerocarpa]MDB9376199.1 hypothetical protein [Nodularia sphaerocarpa CS-585]MDB9377628.1 hypothetical protein [Nodularia sphaerocarpa CS-585A2]ULP74292.1 hypothetical protein BDGGKGIB_03956 [Nodularia sphaerocarpa UHCC 0038]